MASRGASYSRVVRWLKVGLPLLALALLSSIFLIPRQHEFDGGIVYSSADLLRLGEGMSVARPRIEGSTVEGEPFVVEAESATPDGPDPERVDLREVRAEFTQAEGREIRVSAAAGALQPKAQLLSLSGDVRLETSDGYVVETARVETNLGEGEAQAPGPVVVRGPQGEIEAGSFRAQRVEAEDGAPLGGLEPGEYLWFEDGVRVRWTPTPRE